MKAIRRLFPLCGIMSCIFSLHSYCHSQNDPVRAVRDTMITPRSFSSQDTSTNVRSFHQTKSAWLAVGLSAAMPGAGQVYNENYWKVPVILGLGGYWVYEWVNLNNKYKDFRDQYDHSLVTQPPVGNSQLSRIRDFYHDERDKFAWYLGALYFVNLVDAYVGAHLYDFDVGPDLTADGRIVPKVTARIRLRL